MYNRDNSLPLKKKKITTKVKIKNKENRRKNLEFRSRLILNGCTADRARAFSTCRLNSIRSFSGKRRRASFSNRRREREKEAKRPLNLFLEGGLVERRVTKGLPCS